MERSVKIATSPMITFAAREASKPKPLSARTRVASTICASRVGFRHRMRADRHRLPHNPGQHEPRDDHDVAGHHQDDQRYGQRARDAQRDIDRDDQRLVGQRIDQSAKLARHMKALGEKAVDGVADPGSHEEEKGGPHLARRDRPDHNRHENNASQCDEIRNTQTQAPALNHLYSRAARLAHPAIPT